jgi:hypothetical protein
MVFLRNSGVDRVERTGEDAVRVEGVDESTLGPVLETWRSLHPDVETDIVHE